MYYEIYTKIYKYLKHLKNLIYINILMYIGIVLRFLINRLGKRNNKIDRTLCFRYINFADVDKNK